MLFLRTTLLSSITSKSRVGCILVLGENLFCSLGSMEGRVFWVKKDLHSPLSPQHPLQISGQFVFFSQ